MKLKLDENIGRRGAQALAAAGHDVATAREQGLSAASDVTLIEVCRVEGRCLLTLDKGFANPMHYAPARYSGIAVFRLAGQNSAGDLTKALSLFIHVLRSSSVAGRLWIVEPERIREYTEDGSPAEAAPPAGSRSPG
ncbi:MAG: DUF5615 family PIN-like protein [Thermodesulfobacteriota bacterium]